MRHEEGIDIAICDTHFRQAFADRFEGLIFYEIAVPEQYHVGAKVDRGFDEGAVHLTNAEVPQLEGSEEGSHVSITKVEDMVVVSNKSVEEFIFGADSRLPETA